MAGDETPQASGPRVNTATAVSVLREPLEPTDEQAVFLFEILKPVAVVASVVDLCGIGSADGLVPVFVPVVRCGVEADDGVALRGTVLDRARDRFPDSVEVDEDAVSWDQRSEQHLVGAGWTAFCDLPALRSTLIELLDYVQVPMDEGESPLCIVVARERFGERRRVGLPGWLRHRFIGGSGHALGETVTPWLVGLLGGEPDHVFFFGPGLAW
jgi:hypothetical protein